MAEPADINVDELRRRARRRLVGAIVLALGVAVVVPMLLETEQKPLGEDVSVKIPPVDSGRFVNGLNDGRASADSTPKSDGANTNAPPAASDAAPVRTQKYDTRLPDAAAPAENVTPAVTDAGATSTTPPARAAAPSDALQPDARPSTEGNAPVAAATATIDGAKPVGEAAKPGGESAKSASAEKSAAANAHAADGAAKHREGYAVQLAAFADDHGANSLAGRLKKAGYAAYTEPLKTSKGTLWRVRVGPYPSREAAVAARDKLKTEGQSGIVAAIK